MAKNTYIRSVGYDNRYSTWHTLNRNMILFVHSGSGSIVSRERNYPIIPGCLCFVGSNKFYYTLTDNPEKYVRSKLFLSNRELEQVLALFPPQLRMNDRFTPNSMVYAQTNPKDTARLESIFDELSQLGEENCYLDAMNYSRFIELLSELKKNVSDIPFPTAGMVQKAVEYINTHIHEDIGVDNICSQIHVSKYHFCRKFKQLTGYTVMEYILKTRIITSKSLLDAPNLSMSEISENCGFSSQSYFCRVFKEETGMTPLQYRKQRQNPK